jgi:hypothetical protein
MRNGKIVRLRWMGVWLAGAALLGACDAPTDPAERAAAAGPSMLVTPACAGSGGQAHGKQVITTAATWTRANSPHRVSGFIEVQGAGRLTIAPGAVVCFDRYASIGAWNGGRLYARGRDTAQIVLTARDPAVGWSGLSFSGTPAGASYLTNVRIEHVGLQYPGVEAGHQHAVYIDSVVIRRAGRGVHLYSPNSRLSRSRVDTTTDRSQPAVLLASGTRFEQTTVRGAAGTGVRVIGTNALLLGGRIEGSGGTGLQVQSVNAVSPYSRAVRVTGGRSYGVEMPLPALARIYPTPALQDSLLGNARDTILAVWGTLKEQVTAGPRLPIVITQGLQVDSAGIFYAQPGARIVFRPRAYGHFSNGGRLIARGSAASPVVFMADDPELGWYGLQFVGTVPRTSYLVNARIENVAYDDAAVEARDSARMIMDSSVVRVSGRGVILHSPNSRLSRSRVDSTLSGGYPAVDLAANARIESTLVRASAGYGLYIRSAAVVVASCEVRDGERDGIYMVVPVAVRNCNLVNNLGVGVSTIDARTDLRGNWWGSAGGPNAPGGDGLWRDVLHSPWRTTPYVLPYVP